MKNKKIIIAILLIVLIAGIAMTIVKGMEFDLEYSNTKQIDIYIGKQFEINDVKQITNEVLGKQPIQIRKIELYEDSICITAKDISEEQKNEIINKVNEKYGTEVKAEDTQIITLAHIRGREIAKQYIMPITIASVIVLIYLAIRYHKLGSFKVILKTIGIMVLAQLELLSIIAITRLPIGRITIPLAIIIYVLTLLGITTTFEKQLQKVKEENKEENK